MYLETLVCINTNRTRIHIDLLHGNYVAMVHPDSCQFDLSQWWTDCGVELYHKHGERRVQEVRTSMPIWASHSLSFVLPNLFCLLLLLLLLLRMLLLRMLLQKGQTSKRRRSPSSQMLIIEASTKYASEPRRFFIHISYTRDTPIYLYYNFFNYTPITIIIQ